MSAVAAQFSGAGLTTAEMDSILHSGGILREVQVNSHELICAGSLK